MKRNVLTVFFALILLSCSSSAFYQDYMSLLLNASIKEAMSGMDVRDINGDGSLEVLVSSSAEGVVYAFGSDGNAVWKYKVPGYVNFVRAVDLDSNNKSEILTGTSTHLYVLNSSGDLLWKFYTEYNSVEGAEAFDLDGDGLKDVLFSASTGVCGGNVLYALNSSNAGVIWKYVSDFYHSNVIKFVRIDGVDVILVGMVLAPRGMGGCIPNLGKSSKLVALDKNGNELWSFNTSGGVVDLKVEDIDKDGVEEIVVASTPIVYVLSNSGVLKWERDFEDRVEGLALADLYDGGRQILVATYRAYLLSSTDSDYWVLNTSDRAYSVAAGDLNGDGNPEYVVGSDRVYIYDYDRNLVWSSGNLVYVGYLFTGNFDNVPDVEVAVGANKQVLVFKTGFRGSLQKADVYYNRAQQLYSSGEYSSALHYAMQAKDIYYQYQQDNGYRKARSLIDLISVRVNSTYVILLEADDYYDRSVFFYTELDFINASVSAQIARAKYLMLENAEGVNKSEDVLNKSLEFLARNVSEMRVLAVEAYLDGDLEKALQYAENARLIYSFLRANEEVSAMDDFIEQVKSSRKLSLSERLSEFVQKPELKKYLFPSENEIINLSLWFVCIILFGLLLVVLKAAALWVYRRLSRKTLNLDKIQAEKPEEVGGEKQE
ncbi:MAG: hypothetical protein FJY77_02985 [Candidatus Altiarchaeales archaeon]|nr:hypothetical protein [Candidatus Altiarchaeales archaeon]